MSITKSFNKHTGTYYAYNTTYAYDEKLGKKVQKKVCIGQIDPATGEIIPNGKRGRPSKALEIEKSEEKESLRQETLASIQEELTAAEVSLEEARKRLEALALKISSLQKSDSAEEGKRPSF